MQDPNRYIRPHGSIGFREDTQIATIVLYSNKAVLNDISPTNFGLFNKKIPVPAEQANVNKVATAGKIPILNLGANADNYFAVFNNFVLQGVSETDQSINKMHMNFSDSWNIFFFGNSPTMITLNGGFIDTEEMPHYQEFMTAYEKYMRGDKLTGSNLSMMLSYDGKVIDGFILSVATSVDSKNDGFKSFSITVVAKTINWNRTNIVNGQKVRNGMNNIEKLRKSGYAVPNDVGVDYTALATEGENILPTDFASEVPVINDNPEDGPIQF